MRCKLLGERSCEAMGFFIACFSQFDKHSGQKETILLTVSCNTGPAPHLRACLSLILARCLHCSEAFSLSTTCCKLIYMKCTDENLRSSCFCLAPTPIFELSTFPDHGHGAMWMQMCTTTGKNCNKTNSLPNVCPAGVSSQSVLSFVGTCFKDQAYSFPTRTQLASFVQALVLATARARSSF